MADIDEQFLILDVRLGQFLNLWTVVEDYMTGRYIPSVERKLIDENDYRSAASFPWTFVSLLYSFFFSLVDTHPKGLNAFRIWRARFPSELPAIEAVEFRVQDILPELKKYRNKLGFHGSQSFDEEEVGYELLDRHGIVKVLNVAQHFISLAMSFLALAYSKDRKSTKKAKEQIQTVQTICRPNSGYDFQSEQLLANWFRPASAIPDR
jgi:hypothetical protein